MKIGYYHGREVKANLAAKREILALFSSLVCLHKPRFSPHLSFFLTTYQHRVIGYCSRLALGWGMIPLAWKRVCGYWIAAGTLLHLTVARLAQ